MGDVWLRCRGEMHLAAAEAAGEAQRGNPQTYLDAASMSNPIAARLPISRPPCKLNIRWHFPSAATDVVFQACWWTEPLPGRLQRVEPKLQSRPSQPERDQGTVARRRRPYDRWNPLWVGPGPRHGGWGDQRAWLVPLYLSPSSTTTSPHRGSPLWPQEREGVGAREAIVSPRFRFGLF